LSAAPAGWGIPAGLVFGVVLAEAVFFLRWEAWPFLACLSSGFILTANVRLAAVIFGLAWATACLHGHLADRLEPALAGMDVRIQGRIKGLPEIHDQYSRFLFEPSALSGSQRIPRRLLVYWYRNAPILAPEEVWQFELRLKPPWAPVNFQGTDREQWLFAQQIGGLATVKSGVRLRAGGSSLPNWDVLRHQVRKRLTQAVGDADKRAIVAALAIADRSGLTREQFEVLRKTGTAHLLAISGLHVGLVAFIGFWLVRLVVSVAPAGWTLGRAYEASIVAGLLFALAYSGLAGFGVSTARAVAMLAVALLALLVRRPMHRGQGWSIALAVILLCDPLAFFTAGFWLSFAAVGVLLLMSSRSGDGRPSWFRTMMRAQKGIMLVLLPLGVWWFQSASLAGWLANLLAIPYVSIILVPLTVLGLMALPLGPALSPALFSAAAACAGWLLKVLSLLASLPYSSLVLPRPTLWAVSFATAGALLLLLPRGLHHRWLGLLLVLPVFFSNRPPGAGQIQLDVLDVGQGTAVLVSSGKHLLLYDSGPGDGAGFDMVDSVIRPAVLGSGHQSPDRIVISHADLDHAGGLMRLMSQYPDAEVYASLRNRPAGTQACNETLKWAWDGVAFQVLHPTQWLPYLGNESSCVLAIRAEGSMMLLPGDITAVVEQRLLRRQELRGLDFLLVPHHGSESSSAPEFVNFTNPRIAVATAGLGNRFGFPRPGVRRRYRDRGIPLWSTDACGAIRLQIAKDGEIRTSSARRSRPAPWRWPPASDCP